MYGKLFNRIKKGCQTFKDSARSMRTRSKSTSAILTTNQRLSKTEDCNSDPPTSSSNEHLQDATFDTCSHDGSVEEFAQEKSKGRQLSTSTVDSYLHATPSSYTDQFWLGLINSHQYKNWLKIGLALRSVCDFISPVLEEIVHGMHTDLLDKHGYEKLTQEHVLKYKQNSSESDMLRGWVKDILKLHRSPPQPSEIFKMCDIEKWPTYDGAWEIARVFMSRGFRSGGTGGDASSFDVSALLNFMHRCRLVDGYVQDFNIVKRVLQVRNMTMHSPRLEIDDETLEDSFQSILSLLHDEHLCKHAEKYLQTKEFCDSVEKIKSANFDLVTSARHSLTILKDGTFDSSSNNPHPSASILILLRNVLTRILSLPEVHVSANFIKIQNRMTDMEEKVMKDYEEADARIRQMSAHVLHINRQLDRLREHINKSKRSEKETPNKFLSKKNRKRKMPKLANAPTADSVIPYPAGYKKSFKPLKNAFQDSVPLSMTDYFWQNTLASDRNSPDDEFYEMEEQRVRYSPLSSRADSTHLDIAQRTTSQCSTPNLLFYGSMPITSSFVQSPSSSATALSSSALPNASSLSLMESCDRETRKRKTKAPPGKANEISSKRRRSKSPERLLNNKNASRDLMTVPEKIAGGSGGGSFLSFRAYLQAFLNKQPKNSGATFSVSRHSDGKYQCTVTFQSKFALSTTQPSSTQEEAEGRAALEAKKWIIGSANSTQLATAKVWFDAYSKKLVGKLPTYTSFQTSTDLYVTHAHLINNKLFATIENVDPHKLFLEASCKTLNPDINIEEMTIKTALHGTAPHLHEKLDNRQALNAFCLHNGATIPVLHTTSFKHPQSGKVLWTCTLKSFSRELLSQVVNSPKDKEIKKESPVSDSYNLSSSFADFLESQSNEPQRSRFMAEDNAACELLEKLGVSAQQLINLRGRCKKELEFYAYEMDLSAAYYTVRIKMKEINATPMYDCVVSSLCLEDTRQTFTVTSDEEGLLTSEEASESAARNALILLGQDISLSA